MAGNEPVTSPDQRKPINPRKSRIGAVVLILALLAMTFGNHRGKVEDIWLVGVAVLTILLIVGDWVLRRNGLRSGD